jgi:membrane-bound metal-dependent hydrolase YbcI (DUF457 family)
MKGLTHLTLGVAWATCWPQAVAAGADGHPGLFVLAAACGILPDTIDFRLLRYVYPHDLEIIPDPQRPDPALLAQALARAIGRARETGKAVRVRIHTVRVGAGLWQHYRLHFDIAHQRVQVDYTGVVNTSREPVTAEGIDATPLTASATLPCPMALEYQAVTDIDIFDGPTYCLEPLPDGRVMAHFIPWHRQWTHSLVVAATLALAIGWAGGVLAGLVAGGAWALHILADQAGFMGSNLFFPFTRRRTPGRQMAPADHPWVNASLIWAALLLMFWNLARQTRPPVPWLSPGALLLVAGVLPLGAAALAAAWARKRAEDGGRRSAVRSQ